MRRWPGAVGSGTTSAPWVLGCTSEERPRGGLGVVVRAVGELSGAALRPMGLVRARPVGSRRAPAPFFPDAGARDPFFPEAGVVRDDEPDPFSSATRGCCLGEASGFSVLPA